MMSILKKIHSYLTDPKVRFWNNYYRGMYRHLNDAAYLKKRFRAYMGKPLDLNHPKTLNEKLQWLKLYDRNPRYTKLVDKYTVKQYIAETLGDAYVIPTLGVWERFEDIDFDALPNRFVLKCTHDSGGVVVVRDKNDFDREDARKKLTASLARNYYELGREWPYKDIHPRIIAEKYMTDTPDSSEFTDYKFFCFDGVVDCVMVCLDRSSGDTKFYFFDKDWNLKRCNIRGKNAPVGFTIPKPAQMDHMFEIAAKLSVGIPFVRVDLYVSNNQVYFGELTFFPSSGFDPNLLPETDAYFGSLIDLEKVKR